MRVSSLFFAVVILIVLYGLLEYDLVLPVVIIGYCNW